MAINQKLINDQYQYRALCLGIDQAYGSTGVALAGLTNDGKPEIITCSCIPPVDSQSKVEYRMSVVKAINSVLKRHRHQGDKLFALCESVRVYTEGNVSIQNHLNWGALQGSIHDMLYRRWDTTLRTVDTRAWKKAIVGTSKPSDDPPKGVDPKKWPTIQCMMFEWGITKKQLTNIMGPRSRNYTWIDRQGNKCTYNSDIADACAIALYGVICPINKLKFAP